MSNSDTSSSSDKTVKSLSPNTHELFVKNIDPASVDPRDLKISYDPRVFRNWAILARPMRGSCLITRTTNL